MMQNSLRTATIDDLVFQTATNPMLLPRAVDIVENFAKIFIQQCASVLGIKTNLLPSEGIFQNAIFQIADEGSLCLDVGSKKLKIACKCVLPASTWSIVTTRFFGGDATLSNGEREIFDAGAGRALLQKCEKAIADACEKFLLDWTSKASKRRVSVDISESDLYLEGRFESMFDGIHVPFSIYLPSVFINLYWADLRAKNQDEQKPMLKEPYANPIDVEYQANAFIEISDYSLERIVAPTGDQMLVLGDASEILIRLRLDEAQLFEGRLIEKNGKYAVEITA